MAQIIDLVPPWTVKVTGFSLHIAKDGSKFNVVTLEAEASHVNGITKQTFNCIVGDTFILRTMAGSNCQKCGTGLKHKFEVSCQYCKYCLEYFIEMTKVHQDMHEQGAD